MARAGLGRGMGIGMRTGAVTGAVTVTGTGAGAGTGVARAGSRRGWGEGSSNARTERWIREKDDPLVAMREAELVGLEAGLSPEMRREAVLAREQERMQRKDARRARRTRRHAEEAGLDDGAGKRKKRRPDV